MSRTVTGTLLLPNGQPMANAKIFFTAKRNEAVSIVEGSNTFFSTDADGDYSQAIVNGLYGVSIEWEAPLTGNSLRRWSLGDAFVEDGAATTLEALLIVSNPDSSVEPTLLYEVLAQAQQAAADAAASAAEISPEKRAEWDTAYTLSGTALQPAVVGVSVASLVGGKVPAGQLPSYVDDVLEYANIGAFPATGEGGKIYVALAAGTQGGVPFPANQQFRWSGSAYQKLVASPGTTDNVVEGSTNLYHTTARVRTTALTGFVAAVGLNAVLATDTILQAFQKIQGWLSGLGNAAAATLVSSGSDTSLSRVLTTGYMGVGGPSLTRSNDLNANLTNGNHFFRAVDATALTNGPSGWTAAAWAQGISTFWSAAVGTEIIFNRLTNGFAIRQRNNTNTFGPWAEGWTDANLVKVSSNTDNTAGSVVTVNYRGLGDSGVTWNTVGNSFGVGGSFQTSSPSTFFYGVNAFSSTGSGVQIGGRNGTLILKSYTAGALTSEHTMWSNGNTSANVQSLLGSANYAAIKTLLNIFADASGVLTNGSGAISNDVSAMLGSANNAAIRASLDVTDYAEQVVALGNEFGSQEVRCVRVGRQVTITALTGLSHASLSLVSSTVGIIPAQFRPPSPLTIANVIQMVSGTTDIVQVVSDGTFQMRYQSSNLGTAINRTASFDGVSISYSV